MRIAIPAAALLTAICLGGRPDVAFADGEVNAATELGMTQDTFTLGILSISYCERVFRFGPGPMSIVLLWHGGSGRGDDNLAQLTTPSLRPLLGYLTANRINAAVLVPQCPSSAKSWISGGDKSPMMATRALVRNKAQSYRVASTNVFFAGISMGGTAAYSLFAADTPNLFHKAIVCSGAGDTNKAASVTTIVRLFNGADDTIVDPNGERRWRTPSTPPEAGRSSISCRATTTSRRRTWRSPLRNGTGFSGGSIRDSPSTSNSVCARMRVEERGKSAERL